MFKTRKKKLVAHATGKLMSIEMVKDPVFSKKMMGDGYAIDVSGDTIVSPIDGVVELIFPTKHAIGLKSKEGIEYLIHVGMDTVSLEGKGFSAAVEQGQHVKQGDVLLFLDRDFFDKEGISLVTPLVITSGQSIRTSVHESLVTQGEVIEVVVK